MADVFAKARAVVDRMKKAGRARVQIGVMGEFGAKTRGDLDDPDVTVLDIAYLAEYGSDGSGGGPVVRKREPLHKTFLREKGKWRGMWSHLVSRYIHTGDQRAPLLAMGVTGANDVKSTYSAGLTPELSTLTLKSRRHGGDLPFVDTGQTMRSNVAEVVDFDGQTVIVGEGG